MPQRLTPMAAEIMTAIVARTAGQPSAGADRFGTVLADMAAEDHVAGDAGLRPAMNTAPDTLPVPAVNPVPVGKNVVHPPASAVPSARNAGHVQSRVMASPQGAVSLLAPSVGAPAPAPSVVNPAVPPPLPSPAVGRASPDAPVPVQDNVAGSPPHTVGTQDGRPSSPGHQPGSPNRRQGIVVAAANARVAPPAVDGGGAVSSVQEVASPRSPPPQWVAPVVQPDQAGRGVAKPAAADRHMPRHDIGATAAPPPVIGRRDEPGPLTGSPAPAPAARKEVVDRVAVGLVPSSPPPAPPVPEAVIDPVSSALTAPARHAALPAQFVPVLPVLLSPAPGVASLPHEAQTVPIAADEAETTLAASPAPMTTLTSSTPDRPLTTRLASTQRTRAPERHADQASLPARTAAPAQGLIATITSAPGPDAVADAYGAAAEPPPPAPTHAMAGPADAPRGSTPVASSDGPTSAVAAEKPDTAMSAMPAVTDTGSTSADPRDGPLAPGTGNGLAGVGHHPPIQRSSSPADAPAARGAVTNAMPAHQVARALASLGMASLGMATDGSRQLALDLHPSSLGQVQVRITQTGEASARVEITAGQADTLALLRADTPSLHQALDAAGIPAANRDLSFTLAPPTIGPGDATIPGAGQLPTGDNPGQRPAQQGFAEQGFAQEGFSQGDRPGATPSGWQQAGDEDASLPASPRFRWHRAGLDITA